MSAPRYQSFAEFWPYYLNEHSKPATRALHAVGSFAAIGLLIALIAIGKWWLFPLAFLPGYAFAWIGHFFIEKNRPAAFKNPLWSFRGDMKMWRMIVRGTLDAEIERLTKSNGVHGEDGAAHSASAVAALDPQMMN